MFVAKVDLNESRSSNKSANMCGPSDPSSSFDSAGGRGAYAFHAALGSRSRYTARTIDTPCRPLVSDLMGGHPGLIPQLDDETTTLLILVGTNPVVSHGHLIGMTRPAVRLRRWKGRTPSRSR